MAQMDASMFGQQQIDPQEQLEQTVQGILSDSKGVEAWSEVSYGLTEDDKIHFKGTAYFPDINKLFIGTGSSDNQGTKSGDGTIALELKNLQPDQSEFAKGQKDEIDQQQLDTLVKQTKMQYQQTKLMMQGLLADLKVEQIIHLPGRISDVRNFKKTGSNSVRIGFTGDRLLTVMDTVMQNDELLKEQIKAGNDPVPDNF
jgi:hypothetical protein